MNDMIITVDRFAPQSFGVAVPCGECDVRTTLVTNGAITYKTLPVH